MTRREFLGALALAAVATSLPAWPAPRGWNIAHRGGSQSPENTLEAFRRALDLGADGFELDIHLTADRELVVIHDDTLERTGHVSGVVREMTLAQIQQADPSVPSLRDALRVARGRGRVLVEIKQPGHAPRYEGIEKILLAQLAAESMLDSVVVISFERQSMRVVRELSPTLPTGLLIGGKADVAEVQRDTGVTWVAPHYSVVDAAYLERAHGLGLQVDAWTVDDDEALRRMLALGCDAITTNRPARLRELSPTR